LHSVFFRVDDRLIHGQVIEGWVRFINATTILVVDDKVANDPFQKTAMEIAVPPDVKILISTVANSISEVKNRVKNNENTLVLFSNLEDVFRAVTLGLKLTTLNLGGLRFEKGKKLISKTIFLNKQEAKILMKLLQFGISINIQSVPSEASKNIQQILAEKF